MNEVLIDTCFLVALVNPADSFHETAVSAVSEQEGFQLVVTEEVLTEFLNFFSSYGPALRKAASAVIETLAQREDVTVIAQSRDSFAQGFALYRSRLDKSYSATDCISMAVMRTRGIQSVLTNDNHFRQEGFFTVLEENLQSGRR